jgi:hypothetical protein
MFSADLYARVRFLLVLFARETAGAARIRHSPRPLIGARLFEQTSGASRRENVDFCPSSSLPATNAIAFAQGSICDEAIHSSFVCHDGLLRGACHRAALRADPLARNDDL